MRWMAVLAQAEDFDGVTVGGTSFWDTALGNTIEAFLAVIGLLLVLSALFKAVKAFTSGAVVLGFKYIGGGLVVAAFMFRPQLFETLINATAYLLGIAVDTATRIAP